jgi:hypothetical protein
MPLATKGKVQCGADSVSWMLYESGVLKIKPPTAERFLVKLQPGENPAARVKAEHEARSEPPEAAAPVRLAGAQSAPQQPSAAVQTDASAAHVSTSPPLEAPAPLAPGSKARTTGYYYAAVLSGERALPVAPPKRIDAPADAGFAAAGAIRRDIEVKGADNSYYYAHARVKDYHVPTVPQRIEADGSFTPWNENEAAPRRAGVEETDNPD